MKIRLNFIVMLFAVLFASQNSMAAIRSSAVPAEHQSTELAGQLEKNTSVKKTGKWQAKKERWKKKFEKKMAKWTKKAKKHKKKRGTLFDSNYLTLCVILFLAAVVFFAIGGAIFNIFGSVSALAAAIFFVLWLLEYTGNL